MALSRDPITHTIYGDLKRTVHVSIENKCIASAIVILLTGIDVVSGLGRPVGADRTSRAVFERWADTYLPNHRSQEALLCARCVVSAEHNVQPLVLGVLRNGQRRLDILRSS